MLLCSSVEVMCTVLLGVAASFPQVGVKVPPAPPATVSPAEGGGGTAGTAEAVHRSWLDERCERRWLEGLMQHSCPWLPSAGEVAEGMARWESLWWMREGGLAVEEMGTGANSATSPSATDSMAVLPGLGASCSGAVSEDTWSVPAAPMVQVPGLGDEAVAMVEDAAAGEDVGAALEAEKQSVELQAQRELLGEQGEGKTGEPLVCGQSRLPLWLGVMVAVAGVFVLLAVRALRRQEVAEACED